MHPISRYEQPPVKLTEQYTGGKRSRKNESVTSGKRVRSKGRVCRAVVRRGSTQKRDGGEFSIPHG